MLFILRAFATLAVPCAALQIAPEETADGDLADLMLASPRLQDAFTVSALHNMFELFRRLRGRRVILFGDSNDRKFAEALGANGGYGVETTIIKDISGGVTLGQEIDEYTFTQFDVIVDAVWHGGVMSLKPRPSWHWLALEGNQGQTPRSRWIGRYRNGTKLVDSIKMAEAVFHHFALQDNRPMIAVVQSSLWDSVLAKEAMHTGNFEQSSAASTFEGWDWLKRASRLMKEVKKHTRIEKVFWRTTPNCPYSRQQSSRQAHDNSFINFVSAKQAEAVRKAIHQQVGPWAHVGLIDWRQAYSTDKCEDVHYEIEGYERLLQTFYLVMQKYPGGG